MRSILKNTLIVFTLLFILSSCKKSGITGKISPVANVYISGLDNKDAVYWKNGTEVHLTNNGQGAYTSSIFVTPNDDVYVAGSETTSGNSLATYWKNGQVNFLTDSGAYVVANFISVSGSDLYIAGLIEKGNDDPHAVYWKNGQQNGYVNAGSVAITGFVSGADVYLAGYTINSNYNGSGAISDAMYEKNNSVIDISTGNVGGVVLSLYVAGSNVYAAGYGYDSQGIFNYATLWVNGTATMLSKQVGSFAQGVFVY